MISKFIVVVRYNRKYYEHVQTRCDPRGSRSDRNRSIHVVSIQYGPGACMVRTRTHMRVYCVYEFSKGRVVCPQRVFGRRQRWPMAQQSKTTRARAALKLNVFLRSGLFFFGPRRVIILMRYVAYFSVFSIPKRRRSIVYRQHSIPITISNCICLLIECH